MELTDVNGGENLLRAGVLAGELLVADRGYSHVERIAEVHDTGTHVLVRLTHSNTSLWTPADTALDPVAFATRSRSGPGRPARVESTAAELVTATGKRIAARLIIVPKSQKAADKERRRLRREAGRKDKQPTERSLTAASSTFLLTTVPENLASDRVMADLYRVRWQIELAFKRMKSLHHADALRPKEPDLARTYLIAKLVAVLLAAGIARAAKAFPPWGVPL